MAEKYFYALGRRKTSTATIRLFHAAGENTINNKNAKQVYSLDSDKNLLNQPFEVAELTPSDFYYTAVAKGGGVRSQRDAIILALSRAIVKMDESKKTLLKTQGLLTRDPRMVERKKPGLRKARKAEQYSKR